MSPSFWWLWLLLALLPVVGGLMFFDLLGRALM